MKKIIVLIIISINCYSQSNRKINKNDESEFLFTNAINFDFGNTSKNSIGYYGHINYFFNINKDSIPSKYYINTGLIKVNYYSAEINKGTFYQYDNVLENPLSSIQQGESYIKQFNKYDFQVKLNSYSAYVQFLKKITKNYNNLFFHLHGELLVTNVTTDIVVTNIAKQTATIPSNNITPIANYLELDKSFSNQNIGAYFGAGLTAKFPLLSLNSTTKFNYFLQGTMGLSNTKLNPKLFKGQSNQAPSFEDKKSTSPFFIIHSYFENNITGANIIIGSQIRGEYTSPPLYTFYLGLNLDIEKLGNLLK